eukprot:2908304-Rhodomonas_salina.1
MSVSKPGMPPDRELKGGEVRGEDGQKRARRESGVAGQEVVGESGGGGWPMHCDVFGSFEVMSVDDTSVNHMVVESALRPRGFRVTVCLSGEEALERIAKRGFLPDCMLVDCLMPGGMDGFETCRRVRELYPGVALPVIMVSGKGQEQDVTDSQAAGCSDYVTKPFTVAELNEHVDVQLKLKQVLSASPHLCLLSLDPAGLRVPRAFSLSLPRVAAIVLLCSACGNHRDARRVQVWMLEVQRLLVSRSVRAQLDRDTESGPGLLPRVHADQAVLVCNLTDMASSAWGLPGKEFAEQYNALLDAFEAAVAEEAGVQSAMDECFVAFASAAQGGAARMLRLAKRLVDEADRAGAGQGKRGVRVQVGLATGEVVEMLVGLRARCHVYGGQGVVAAWEALLEGGAGCITSTHGVQEALEREGAAGEVVLCSEVEAEGADGPGVRTYVVKHGAWRSCVDSAAEASLSRSADDTVDEEEEEDAEPRWTCDMRGFLAGPAAAEVSQARRLRKQQMIADAESGAGKRSDDDDARSSDAARADARCKELEQQLAELRAAAPECLQCKDHPPPRPLPPTAAGAATRDKSVRALEGAVPAMHRALPGSCAECAARRAQPAPSARAQPLCASAATPPAPGLTANGAVDAGEGSRTEGTPPVGKALKGRARIREGAKNAIGSHMLLVMPGPLTHTRAHTQACAFFFVVVWALCRDLGQTGGRVRSNCCLP